METVWEGEVVMTWHGAQLTDKPSDTPIKSALCNEYTGGAAGHNNGASHITLSHNNPLSEEYNSLAWHKRC